MIDIKKSVGFLLCTMNKMSVFLMLLFLFKVTAAYGDVLTLQDCLSQTETGNKLLKVAQYDTKLADENVSFSRSGYLPRVDINGGYTAQQAPQSINVPAGSFETQNADYAFASLAVTQTLYDFGRTNARVSQAESKRDATSFTFTTLKQDIFLRTVIAYFRILQDKKLLKAADDEVAQMADHLRVAQNLYEQGVVTRNDLLQAEVRLSSSQQHRLEAANRLANVWLDLNNLMNKPPESRWDLVEDTKIVPGDMEKSASEAISSRPEILAQRKLFEANEADVKENRTGYYPELYARLGLDYVQNDKVREQAIYSATVGLKINIFDGFATSSRYRQAVKNRSRTEERLSQLESDLALEFRTALNDANVARERINLTETSIKQGEENLRINKDRYQEQVGTATDVIDAQTLLTQIRTEHYQALFDYEVALARVKRARGEL